MIRRPDAFLFDEPLSDLGAELGVQMRGEISEMQRQLTTTVYATHDQVEAMTMGDRIAVMSQGRIMQVGVPTALYKRPANTFVAGFIGSPRMNLLDAKDLLGDAAATVDRGRGSTLGIRPEHLPIGESRVNRIDDLGYEALVHLSNPRGAHLTVRTSGGIRGTVRAGETLSHALQPDRLHTFDSTTGERLP